MKNYRVSADSFQIGSTTYEKGEVLPLPEVAGEFGVANGSLTLARRTRKKKEPGKYARRDMEATARVVVPEETTELVSEDPDTASDSDE